MLSPLFRPSTCLSALARYGSLLGRRTPISPRQRRRVSSGASRTKRREVDHEPAYSALWMHLLLEILRLCADALPEVRMGAIQTLFRTLQLYGATLSLDTLSPRRRRNALMPPSSPSTATHIDDVDTPASDSSSSPSRGESKVAALQSIGATMSDFPHVEDHTFALVRLGVGNLRHTHPWRVLA
jgi:hypothetical protein